MSPVPAEMRSSSSDCTHSDTEVPSRSVSTMHRFSFSFREVIPRFFHALRERLRPLSPNRHPRILRYLLLLLILALMGTAWLERRAVLERSSQILAWQLSLFLGEHVAFETFDFDVLNLAFEARGLTVRSNTELPEEPYLSVESISASLAAFPSQELIHLKEVRVISPKVRLELLNGRLLHFPGIQALIDAAENETPTPVPEKPLEKGPQIQVDQVVVEDADIVAGDSGVGWNVGLQGLHIEARDIGTRPGVVMVSLQHAAVKVGEIEEEVLGLSLRADLSQEPSTLKELFLRVPGAEVHLEGTFFLGDPPPATPRGVFNLLGEVELAVLGRYLPAQAPDITGDVKLDAEVSLGPDLSPPEGPPEFNATALLELADVVINPFHTGPDEGFVVGDGTLEVAVNAKEVRVVKGRLAKAGGELALEGSLGFSESLPMKVNATLKNVGLGGLLEDVTLKGPWMDARVTGALEVDGTLNAPFLLDGQANLVGEQYVLSSVDFQKATLGDRVFALPKLSLSSEVRIDGDAATLRGGLLETAASRVFVDGTIGFDQTLDLTWDAVELDVGEVSPLSGFFMKGSGWAKGRVLGPFSDLMVSADSSLFKSQFDEYFLGDLTVTFLAPLNSSTYLERLKRFQAGERVGPAEFYEVPGLPVMLELLAEADTSSLGGRMKQDSPAMLLMPDLRSRVGGTVIEGPVGVVFAAPYPMVADLTIDPGPGDATGKPMGQLTDLLTIPGWQIEGDPLKSRVRGHVRVVGPPAQLTGAGELLLMDGVGWGQNLPLGRATLRVDAGVLTLEPFQLRLSNPPPRPSPTQEPLQYAEWLETSLATAEMLLNGTLKPDTTIDAVLELTGLAVSSLEGTAGVGLEGRTRGLLSLTGTLDLPRVDGHLALEDAKYDGEPLGPSNLTLTTVDRELTIKGLLLGPAVALEARVGLADTMPYSLEVAVEALDLEPYLFPVPPGGQQVTHLRVNARARARGEIRGEMPLQLEVVTRDVAFTHKGIALNLPGAQRFVLENNVLTIPGSRLSGDRSAVLVSGTMPLKGPVDLELQGELDVALLDALAPGIFQRIEGTLQLGEGARSARRPVKIQGTLDALQFYGPLLLHDAVVRTVSFPPTLDRLEASIMLDGNEVRIERLNGYLGGGPLDGQGVMILGPDYYPVHYDLEVHGRDAFMRYPSFLPPGVSDLDLKLVGEVESLLLSGDINLKRMVYRERYNWEQSLTDFRTYQLENLDGAAVVEEESPLFDIDIRIHVPGTFYIRNNIGNIQLRAELQLTGDTNVMALYGDVDSVRGTVAMLDNTFELVEGHIEFQGDYYNPRLNLKMQTQIQSYSVYYLVTGYLSDWQLIPGSDSGLSERDINSLIAFRTLADNITEGNDARAVAAPALEFLIGRLGLLEQLQGFTMLDRFTILPATDQSGNLAARVSGEKELVQNRLFASGYYDLSFNGSQDFLADLEWRALECCSLILRFDNNQSLGPLSISPGVRLKLKLELE